METDEERPAKRIKTLGSKGLIKESEFIRIITHALYSLGFEEIGKLLEEKSEIPLHSNDVKMFLEQVKNGEWDKSIATLQEIELQNKNAVKFLLLEQKFFGFLKLKKATEALDVLRKDIKPLGVNTKRVHELALKLVLDPGKDMEFDKKEFVEKLQNLFPPSLIVPEKRLEYLIERALDYELIRCNCHNIPNFDMSLFSDHHCEMHKLPSETLQTLEKHTDEVWFLKFSNDGKYLASSSKDKSAIIWEIDAEGKFLEKHKLVGHEKPVVMVLSSPDGKQVITCGKNEVIRRWDVESGECVGTYEKKGVGSVSCGCIHDGSGIISVMTDRRICFWELDGTEIKNLDGTEQDQMEHLQDIAIATDGKCFLNLGKLCFIAFHKSENKADKEIKEEDMISSFSVSRNNKRLLINLISQKIHLWNIEDEPYKLFEFSGHKRSWFINRSCFGGYGDNFIASGSEDSQVYIWSIQSARKEPCSVLRGHSGAVNCVSWNPTDLHMLASASDDGTIRIWGIDKKLNGNR